MGHGHGKGAGHAGKRSNVELGPTAHLCFCYAPKWSSTGSRGGGEAM